MEMNEKLAELRKAKGLTQKELAEALNVTRQAVSRWEVGTAAPSLDNLAYLSRLYGMPLDELVNEGEAAAPDVPGLPAPEGPPACVPGKAVRPRAPLVPVLLAVLILGVGILIGLSLRKPTEEVHLYPSDPGERTVGVMDGWLEKTPADIQDEKRYLESGGHTKENYSIYYPGIGVLRTFPNDTSEETSTPP